VKVEGSLQCLIGRGRQPFGLRVISCGSSTDIQAWFRFSAPLSRLRFGEMRVGNDVNYDQDRWVESACAERVVIPSLPEAAFPATDHDLIHIGNSRGA
jgi:hypothetical protein